MSSALVVVGSASTLPQSVSARSVHVATNRVPTIDQAVATVLNAFKAPMEKPFRFYIPRVFRSTLENSAAFSNLRQSARRAGYIVVVKETVFGAEITLARCVTDIRRYDQTR